MKDKLIVMTGPSSGLALKGPAGVLRYHPVLVIAMALSGLIMGVQTGVIRIIAGGHPPIPSDFWAFPIRSVHYLISRLLTALIVLHRALLDPIGASARDQIVLGSPLAIVVAQIGFGAFPLAAAIFLLVCALSGRTLRFGLVFVLILDLTALLVRALGVLKHGGFADNRGPFIGESVLAALAISALLWGHRAVDHNQR